MHKFAGGINPNLAADLSPAQAKPIVLAQIRPGIRIDDAIKPRKQICTRRRVPPRPRHGQGVHALEMGLRISGHHSLQCPAANQVKSAAPINSRGKISFLLPLGFGTKGFPRKKAQPVAHSPRARRNVARRNPNQSISADQVRQQNPCRTSATVRSAAVRNRYRHRRTIDAWPPDYPKRPPPACCAPVRSTHHRPPLTGTRQTARFA